MLALVITLHLAAIGEPQHVHLVPGIEIAQAPLSDTPWLMGDQKTLQRRVIELTNRINAMPTTLSGGSVVIAALGFTFGGILVLTGGLMLLAVALSPLTTGLLEAGAITSSLGLFLVGMSTGVLIMGNSEMEERKIERQKLVDERRELDRALERLNRRADVDTSTLTPLTLARF